MIGLSQINEASPKTVRNRIARETSRLISDLKIAKTQKDCTKIVGGLTVLSIAASLAETNQADAGRLVSAAKHFALRDQEGRKKA